MPTLTTHGLPYTSRILHAATARGSVETISDALHNTLKLAEELSLTSLALPTLGAGTGGLPIDACARTTRDAITAWSADSPDPQLRELTIVLWTAADLTAFDLAFTTPTTPA